MEDAEDATDLLSEKPKRSRASEILAILTKEWEVAAYILRARHMTERDAILDKYMERQDLFCDELRDHVLEHFRVMEVERQKDFGHFEYEFDYKYIEPKSVNNRTRYFLKLGDEHVMINNYTKGRTIARTGIKMTKKLYIEKYIERLPCLCE